MDRDVDAAVDGFWLLTGMDGKSGETLMLVGEILALCELFVLNFGLALFVKHLRRKNIISNLLIFIRYCSARSFLKLGLG